jgi:hypothetical protein
MNRNTEYRLSSSRPRAHRINRSTIPVLSDHLVCRSLGKPHRVRFREVSPGTCCRASSFSVTRGKSFESTSCRSNRTYTVDRRDWAQHVVRGRTHHTQPPLLLPSSVPAGDANRDARTDGGGKAAAAVRRVGKRPSPALHARADSLAYRTATRWTEAQVTFSGVPSRRADVNWC